MPWRITARNLLTIKLVTIITLSVLSTLHAQDGVGTPEIPSAFPERRKSAAEQWENIPIAEGAVNNPRVQVPPVAPSPNTPEPSLEEAPSENAVNPDTISSSRELEASDSRKKSPSWKLSGRFSDARLAFSIIAEATNDLLGESIVFEKPEGYGFKILTKEGKLWPWLLIPKGEALPLKASDLPNASALISEYLPVTFVDLLRYTPHLKSLGIFTLDYVAPKTDFFYSLNDCLNLSSRPSELPKINLISSELDVEKHEEFEIATDSLSRYYFHNDELVMKEVISGDIFRRLIYFYIDMQKLIAPTDQRYKKLFFRTSPSSFLVAMRMQIGRIQDLDPKINHDLLFLLEEGTFCPGS